MCLGWHAWAGMLALDSLYGTEPRCDKCMVHFGQALTWCAFCLAMFVLWKYSFTRSSASTCNAKSNARQLANMLSGYELHCSISCFTSHYLTNYLCCCISQQI